MRAERAKKFLELVRQGKTYQEIGDSFGLSKTTVYIDLKKFYPEETKKALKEIGWHKGKYANVKRKEKVTITCRNCGKTLETEYRYYRPTFCGRECFGAFLKKQWKRARDED